MIKIILLKKEITKIQKAYRAKFREFDSRTQTLVDNNTKRLHRAVYNSLSQRSKATQVQANGKKSRYPGLGISTDVIGVQSGKLRNALELITTKETGYIYTGQVGYSKSTYSLRPSGAIANALNSPSTVRPYIYQARLKQSKYKGFDDPLSKYIGIVLLGSEKIHGRNVLRLALYRDIINNRSYKSFFSTYRGLVGNPATIGGR